MSLNGLRAALAEDPSFARVQIEAANLVEERSADLQIGAPPGLRAALLAEAVEGLTQAHSDAAGHDASGTGYGAGTAAEVGS